MTTIYLPAIPLSAIQSVSIPEPNLMSGLLFIGILGLGKILQIYQK